MTLKFVPARVVQDAGLGERQIRVIANSGKSDRVKDTLKAGGARLDAYRRNPIVLADHDRKSPIGNFAPEVDGDALVGVVTFAPAGISTKADEYCGLYKSGVMTAVSVGFDPVKVTPNKAGGLDFEEWELMELSCVAVPCDSAAVTIARSAPEGPAADWKVGASRNLPPVVDQTWDAAAAAKSILDHCGFGGASPDTTFARKGFLAYDARNPADPASYRLPFAKMIDGRLTASLAGVRAAAKALPELAEPARAKATAALAHYEAIMPKTAIRAKGLYDVAQLAYLLHQLGWAHLDAVAEAVGEGDGSKVPEMLATALRALADAFVAMSAEEAAELIAANGLDADFDPEGDDDDGVEMTAPAIRKKRWNGLVSKAGRALSAANVEHVAALEKCLKGMDACHVKAADLHDDLHATLAEMRDHGTSAGEHVKALREAGKPKPDAEDEPDDSADPDADEEDHELAFDIEQRKRVLMMAELGNL